MMNTLDFGTRLGSALLLGCLVGLERQWRQRMTGMRTNSLVSVGSALFVTMGSLISGGDSEGRVASYVVSGIGFLGGGVILKDGFNIRGLNTAATLWCTAAVGTLAGTGHLLFAAIGALAVVLMNLVLRPVARLINWSRRTTANRKYFIASVALVGLRPNHMFEPSCCKMSGELRLPCSRCIARTMSMGVSST